MSTKTESRSKKENFRRQTLTKRLADASDKISHLRSDHKDYDDEQDGFEPDEDTNGLRIATSKATRSIQLPPTAGVSFKEHTKPFLVDAYPNPVWENAAWAKDLNVKFSDEYPFMPKFPFIIGITGSINAGKTNLAAHLVHFFIHKAKVQNVTVCSTTAQVDSTWAGVKHMRPPKLKFNLRTDLPRDLMDDDLLAVSKEVLPLINAAEHGIFADVDKRKAAQQLRLYADIYHPWTDAEGTPTGHEPRIHPNLLIDARKKQWFAPEKEHRAGLTLPEATAKKAFAEPHKLALPPGASVDAKVLHHNLNPLSGVLNIEDYEMRDRYKSGRLFLKKEPYKNHLYVLDDPYEYFHNKETCKYLCEWALQLRHRHNSAILMVQKLSLVPTAIRAQISYWAIWRVKSAREWETLSDEFGDAIPNFEEMYNACTTPTNDCPKPFMFIDLTCVPPKVSRCLQFEAIPTADPEDTGAMMMQSVLLPSSTTTNTTSSSTSSTESRVPPSKRKKNER